MGCGKAWPVTRPLKALDVDAIGRLRPFRSAHSDATRAEELIDGYSRHPGGKRADSSRGGIRRLADVAALPLEQAAV